MGLDYRVKCCPDGLVTDRRRRIKVLDCTIRDGGLCNNWHFEHSLVQRVFRSLADAGIDYMEVGYQTAKGVFDRDEVGPWRFCDEEDLFMVNFSSSYLLNLGLACLFDYKRMPMIVRVFSICSS